MSFPKRGASFHRQITKPNPHIAPRITGKVCSTNLLVLLGQIPIDPVRIKRRRVPPLHFRCLRVDPQSGVLSDCEPLLDGHFFAHDLILSSLLCSVLEKPISAVDIAVSPAGSPLSSLPPRAAAMVSSAGATF